MLRNWYLRPQAEMVVASTNFKTLITASPVTYGLVAGQATAYGLLDTALQSAWTAWMAPSTRTPVAREAKDLAIANARNMAIALSKIAYATQTVTDQQLVDLGLLPRTSPTPVPPELTAPVVEVESVVGRLAKIRIHTAPDSGGTRRPNGSVGAQIFTFIGTSAPTDPRAYHYEGVATRGTAEILFPNDVPAGATAWIAASWLSRRGVASMACQPVPVSIQGGMVLPEQAVS